MFYGRVDVYWPDGPIESYRLNKAVVAVGRSSGNDLVLDTTGISRYHLKLTFNEYQARLEDLDSANGTYVDSVRLSPHESYVLRGGEEIQIGGARLIYHPPAALDSSGAEEITQRVVLARTTYRVALEGPDMAVAPGAHVQALLKIENIGEQADRFFIELDGLPKAWVRVDRTEMELAAGEMGQAVVSFKPLRRSETRPEDYPFVVRVRAKSTPAETVDAPAVLTVLPFSGFGMALGSERLLHGEQLKVFLHNQGNAPLPIDLSGADKGNALIVELSAPHVTLLPGERQTVTGTVYGWRRKLFGALSVREFAVIARSRDSAGFTASVPGSFVERGMLPGWLPVLLLPLLVIGVLAAAMVALLVLDRAGEETPVPASPTISAYALSANEIMLGETVTVTWTVSGARSLLLRVVGAGGEQRIALPVDVSTYNLTLEASGRYTVTLEARRDEENAISAADEISVRPAMSLTAEVVDGGELVRHVVQEVQLTWTVNGAQPYEGGYMIWATSPDVAGNLLAAPMPLSGQQRVRVTPDGNQAEWLVTLYAQGHDGTNTSVTQKVPIGSPVCELSAAQTTVRSGPGEHYPAILAVQPLDGPAQGALSYSPVARDPSGAWLRVEIDADGQLGWVPLADFACMNFDPQRLVTTTDYPVLPTPTATPTPSPTYTPSPSPSPTARLATATATSSILPTVPPSATATSVRGR
ncbi:MAG: FHA domain-containing protein [Anaerolineae bacterium]|nr:FHA domain-containing protein [Anaerolineae bacterium]